MIVLLSCSSLAEAAQIRLHSNASPHYPPPVVRPAEMHALFVGENMEKDLSNRQTASRHGDVASHG
jgi:hypothetical protein